MGIFGQEHNLAKGTRDPPPPPPPQAELLPEEEAEAKGEATGLTMFTETSRLDDGATECAALA